MPGELDDLEGTVGSLNRAVLGPNEVHHGRHVLRTRQQSARRMGVSLATVRRMEGGELQPVIVDGKHTASKSRNSTAIAT